MQDQIEIMKKLNMKVVGTTLGKDAMKKEEEEEKKKQEEEEKLEQTGRVWEEE